MLTSRLKSIAQMVPKVQTAADIGCDHGKVAVWLVQNGRVQTVVCGDISAPSLDKARMLAKAAGVDGHVLTRVGNGFDVLATGEAQAAVLAGMGGELMVRILEEGGKIVPDTLVLSCNRDAALVRKWLCGAGFVIEDEALVFENGIYYPVIRAKRGRVQELTQMEMQFGPVLLKNKPRLLKAYVEHCMAKTQSIIDQLQNAQSPRAQRQIKLLQAKLDEIKEVCKCL